MSYIEYKGTKWQKYHGALIPLASPLIEIDLSKEEAKYLLKKSGAYFVRYTSHWDIKRETAFWYIIKDSFGGMEELSANTRSKLRRGFKNCTVKKVTNEEIAQHGYEVYKKAFDHYKTHIAPVDKNEFYNDTLNSKDHDYFAVYYKEQNNKMIAYSKNKIEKDIVDYSTIKFHPDFLKNYSSYVLFYEMNKYYLSDKKIQYVNDGARSISHNTNIQDFLMQKFKFRKAYCVLHIVYRWDIGIAVKLLYPFKNIIGQIDNKIFNRLLILLKQETIRRTFDPL